MMNYVVTPEKNSKYLRKMCHDLQTQQRQSHMSGLRLTFMGRLKALSRQMSKWTIKKATWRFPKEILWLHISKVKKNSFRTIFQN